MKEGTRNDDREEREESQIVPSSSQVPTTLTQQIFRLNEKLQITLEKSEAVGRIRMILADFLIEEGLVKRRLRR